MNIFELFVITCVAVATYWFSKGLGTSFGSAGWIVGGAVGVAASAVLFLLPSRRINRVGKTKYQSRFKKTPAILTMIALVASGYLGASLMDGRGIVGVISGGVLGVVLGVLLFSSATAIIRKLKGSN